jgi:acetylornithine deacetylase/succinyl-diaminopimelate desuccinylase family protein
VTSVPPSDLERRVLEQISADDVVEMTQRLVRAPGENPPGEEAATAAVLLDLAVGIGLEHRSWQVAPGRPNVEVTLSGGKGPGLLLLGHTDVVPVGEGWTVDPFGGEVREGRLHGRGSSDMKGGLAAALVAMRALRTAGATLSGPVLLAALADEEQTGLGVREWIARPERAELLGCIVAEPTDLQTVVAARGDCYLLVRVQGVAAHAGRPDDGRNAIHGAAAIVAELERWHAEYAEDPHPLVGAPTFNVGVIHGGSGASVVPAECRIEVDRRLLPQERAADVLEEVRARLVRLGLEHRGLTWSVESPMDMPGFETPPDHALVRTALGAVKDAGGPALPPSGWTAACDGGFVATRWGVPVVVLGPGSVNEQAHRADESVGVDELVVAARAYALAALRLLS